MEAEFAVCRRRENIANYTHLYKGVSRINTPRNLGGRSKKKKPRYTVRVVIPGQTFKPRMGIAGLYFTRLGRRSGWVVALSTQKLRRLISPKSSLHPSKKSHIANIGNFDTANSMIINQLALISSHNSCRAFAAPEEMLQCENDRARWKYFNRCAGCV